MTNNNVSASIPGVVISMDDTPVPGDYGLLRPWFNLVRSLRSCANVGAHAVLTVHIVVDELGRPVHNTRPRVTRLEPKAQGGALEALLDELTG